MMVQSRANEPAPRVSVMMPTFRHAGFIARAIRSVLAQSIEDWELLIIDDGSPDDTRGVVAPYLTDARLRYRQLASNVGLGAALNLGLESARAPFVAYLPSDDVWYADHLSSLLETLEGAPESVLAYSGVVHHSNRVARGVIEGYALQLVQVVHRATSERWIERVELVTDDLDRMFWGKLRKRGAFIRADSTSCEWVDHPQQLHKVLREPFGGINPFRVAYGVREPIRFHSSAGNLIDEVERYRQFRERADTPLAGDGLRIVLAGELAYNAERVLALEERGNKLYGLWTPDPYWFNTVGPLPFGHVEDLPRDSWRQSLRTLRPDLIYALLNWQAVPFAHSVMRENPGIPFVWHFKEGPHICIEKGMWTELADLRTHADGVIYSSPEMRDWFETTLPDGAGSRPAHVLDGDLPKREWFTCQRSPRLSASDGDIHTVVPGRPIGLHPPDVAALAEQGIHLHFYGDFTHGQWREWIAKAERLAPQHLHLHANVDQEQWVREFSQYDAGWLHIFRSQNAGEMTRANWDDLNYPARIATLVAAGLPLLQRDNSGSIVAAQTLARQRDLGVFFSEWDELGAKLRDEREMERVRDNVWRQREQFTFDAHADDLLTFFRTVIANTRVDSASK